MQSGRRCGTPWECRQRLGFSPHHHHRTHHLIPVRGRCQVIAQRIDDSGTAGLRKPIPAEASRPAMTSRRVPAVFRVVIRQPAQRLASCTSRAATAGDASSFPECCAPRRGQGSSTRQRGGNAGVCWASAPEQVLIAWVVGDDQHEFWRRLELLTRALDGQNARSSASGCSTTVVSPTTSSR